MSSCVSGRVRRRRPWSRSRTLTSTARGSHMDKLRDRVAIVTGGARGIGGAIAGAFAAEGADVVIADRLDESVAAPVVAAVQEAGRRAIFVATDISQEDQVNAMVHRAYSEFGDIDILVNNAGIFSQVFFH